MNKLEKMRLFLASCMMGMAMSIVSCSSENGENDILDGKGTIRLGMSTGVDFGVTTTRSVNLADYQDKNNYTVQILKSDGTTPVHEFTYADMPSIPLELDNGTYTLKAFYGTEKVSSRNGFRVEGAATFSVQSNEQTVSVACAPTCAKVSVDFDGAMGTYFSDYSVIFETEALAEIETSVTWAKADTDPWYLKVNKAGEVVKATIRFTRKAEYGTGISSASVEKTYALAPNKAWTLKIAPSYESGKLGVAVTIDETTNDHDVDIIVPSEWI